MISPDRPAPRRRATPAPDEAAGATPIAPQPQAAVLSRPPVPAPPSTGPAATRRRKTYAQLNVRLDDTEFAQFEAIQAHDGTSQIDTVRTLIREANERRGLG